MSFSQAANIFKKLMYDVNDDVWALDFTISYVVFFPYGWSEQINDEKHSNGNADGIVKINVKDEKKNN